MRGAQIVRIIISRAFSFCEVLQKLRNLQNLRFLGVLLSSLPSSGSFCFCCLCCCQRMAAFCMQAHRAPGVCTGDSSSSAFTVSWNPQCRLCMGLPVVSMGQERFCWSAAGVAQGNVSLTAPKARPLLRVQLGHNDDGCP